MKKEKAFKKIDRKIYIVFLAVIAIAFFNAVFSSYTILQSQKTTQEIVGNMNPSMQSLSHLNLLVIKSRMLCTNWVYLPSDAADKDVFISLNDDYRQSKSKLKLLMNKWHDHAMTLKVEGVILECDRLMANQALIMKQMDAYDRDHDPQNVFNAQQILENAIIPNSHTVDSQLKNIILQQSVTTEKKQDQMLQQLNTLMAFVFGIAILIVGSLIFVAFLMSRTFIVPVMRVREIILEMSQGRLPEYKMHIPKNAVGEMLGALKVFTESVKRTSHFAEEIGKGNLDIPFEPLSNDDIHGHALLTMRKSIKEAGEAEAERRWINEGLSQLHNIMRGNADDFNKLLDNIINLIADYVNIQQAAIFLLNNDNMEEMHIQLGAYYALNKKILNCKRFELKEGLLGQALSSNTIIDLENVNDPFFTIDSGLSHSRECHLMIIPLSTSGKVVGALEIASINKLSSRQKELLRKIAEPVASSLFSVRANLITSQLLEESRKQAEELADREQDLRTINHQLTEKSQELAKSEVELRLQQDELRELNNTLKEKARLLEEKNIAIEEAHQSIAFKAEQLEQSNKYKSSFLANMSHELRTPLNSILILAKILTSNKNNSLSEKQVEHAKVIYKSGMDLLSLINDILDLSKVEAGQLDLQLDHVDVYEVAENMRMLFDELAKEKQITFQVFNEMNDEIFMLTDKIRLEQIIKNLISNALKFTPAGGTVSLRFNAAGSKQIFKNISLLSERDIIAITVQDNGIGIPEEKQSLIFEAFKQADGSTSRSYGGTGLGLSISRELAALMGGEINLISEVGRGSLFTLFLPCFKNSEPQIPVDKIETTSQPDIISKNSDKPMQVIRDDKHLLSPNDTKILIIEDDHIFAQTLVNQCHQHGMKAIVALQGEEGLLCARNFCPNAIILDMRLPVMDGWTVLQHLKSDEQLRQIPVHIVSSMDKYNIGMAMGATGFHLKPSGTDELEILMKQIVNSIDKNQECILALGKEQGMMKEFLPMLEKSASPIHYELSNELSNCLDKLNTVHSFRCIIVDKAILSNIEEDEKLKEASHKLEIPLIYLDGKPDECLREVKALLQENLQESLKNEITSTSINLMFTSVESRKEMLKGKTVLLADDDMRNIYSITSILESEGMNVHCAVNGNEAIEILNSDIEIDIVLMDIMMPQLDGCEAIRQIRKNDKLSSLPIIAITAGAMPNEFDKCIQAGASDYISKPINTDVLFSVMQAWLHQ